MNPALGIAVPRFWRFEVSGLFDTGMFQYDNQFVVVRRDVAQKFTGLGDAVSGIAVRVDDPDHAPAIGAALEKRLGYRIAASTGRPRTRACSARSSSRSWPWA